MSQIHSPTPSSLCLSLSLSVSRRDILSSSGETILASLSNSVTAAQRSDSSLVLGCRSDSGGNVDGIDIPLGQLKCRRFLSLSRCSLWWQSPTWGKHASEIPMETQFLLLELHDGTYALMLPLIVDGKFRATIQSQGSRKSLDGNKDEDVLGLRIESGSLSVTAKSFESALLVSISRDPFELISETVPAAAKLSGSAMPRSAKVVPESADLFGWCTWDAFYSRVSSAAICKGLDSLAKGGMTPGKTQFRIAYTIWRRKQLFLLWLKPHGSVCNSQRWCLILFLS